MQQSVRSTHRLRDKAGLTTQEVMEVLRISRSTLARHCRDGVIPRPAKVTERHLLYHTDSVFELLERQWSEWSKTHHHVTAPST